MTVVLTRENWTVEVPPMTSLSNQRSLIMSVARGTFSICRSLHGQREIVNIGLSATNPHIPCVTKD